MFLLSEPTHYAIEGENHNDIGKRGKMSFKLSMKDINFIRGLFRFLNIFLITPWYNFNKNTFYKPNLCKCYGCVLLLLNIFLIVYIITDESFVRLYGALLFSQKFIFFGSYGSIIGLCLLTIVKSSLWDVDNWKILLRNFQYVDLKLQNQAKVEVRLVKNFYFGLFVKHSLFTIFAIYSTYVWSSMFGFTLWKTVIVTGLKEMYYEFLTVNLLNSFIQSFKSRYEDLNERLLKIGKERKAIQELADLAHCYRILGETIEIFNKMFGVQLIMIIFHCGTEIVSCLNITFVSFVMGDNSLYLHIMMTNFAVLICISVSLTVTKLLRTVFLSFQYNVLTIIIPIDSAVKEAKRFVDLCYKLQEEFIQESKEIEVLTRLVDHSNNFMRKFSAAGYFKINKGIILSLVGNVATYFIITIQLNESQRQQIVVKN
jgi:hypothetical protein